MCHSFVPHHGGIEQASRRCPRGRIVRLLLLAVLAASGVDVVYAGSLIGPYDVEMRRSDAGVVMAPIVCPPPPPPQTIVTGRVFYMPGTGSAQINPAARAADEAMAASINNYMAFVVRTADDYMRSRPADPTRATCVVRWLDAWASAGALLKAPDQQGRYLRNWTQADLAIAYLTVRDAPHLDGAAKQRVERWFAVLGAAVNADFRDGWERNNHLHWAAVSAVSAGVITDDHALFDWGVSTVRAVLAEIQSDGTLPLELARRDKALGYHVFAMQALALVATFAARNGTDLWHAEGGALLRLGDLLVRDLQNPSLIGAKAGYLQDTHDLQGWPSRQALSWAEPYYAVSRDPRLIPYLRAARPSIGSTRNGGDMTLAFGARLPG